jgi:hypothetical protein
MKTFKDLEFQPHFNDENGIMARMSFDNGFGVSVIKTLFSYGSKQGLYELAVLDSSGSITYDTTITDDVLGYLSEDEVTENMIKIQKILTFNLK